jgi:hypothetical protein
VAADIPTTVQARRAGELAGRNEACLFVVWLLCAATRALCLVCPPEVSCETLQGWLKADVPTSVQARRAGTLPGRNQAGLLFAWLLCAVMRALCLVCPSVHGVFCEMHQGWLKADVHTTVQARKAGEVAGRN